MKGNRTLRLVATLVVVMILAMSLSLFAFAGGSTFSIPEGTKVVTKGMVPDDTTVINIPSSVVSIESGAFANCKGLDTVNIDNISGSVVYDASAFYGGTISVHYLKSRTNVAETTTKQPVTQAQTSEPATELVTEPETEVVTDMTPFASAKKDLSGVDLWGNLVSNAGDKETPSEKSGVLTNVLIYVATGAVIIGGVAFCVIKFRNDKNSA